MADDDTQEPRPEPIERLAAQRRARFPATGPGADDFVSRTLEEIPPEGRVPFSGHITADMDIPLRFPFDDWEQRVLLPTLDRLENLRRTIAGDVHSLAWELLAGDDNFRSNIDALQERLAALWEDDKGGGVARLEAQLHHIHTDIRDPEGGLTATVAAGADSARTGLDAIKRVWETSDPTAPISAADLLKALVDTQDADIAGLAEALQEFADELEARGQDLGFVADSELLRSIPWMLRAIARFVIKPRIAKGKSAAAALGATLTASIMPGATELMALSAFLVAAESQSILKPETVLANLNTAFSDLVVGTHGRIQDALATDDPQDLDGALGRAATALQIALTAGLSAHLYAVAIERFAPGKSMGMGQVAGFLADMSSFQSIARGLWGNMINAAVDRPLEQLWNTKWPTRIPPFGEVLAMARKHEYDADPKDPGSGIPGGYIEDMLRLGIPQKWTERFWRYQWADPRLYDIIRMADIGLVTGPPDPQSAGELAHYALDPADPDWWFKLKFKKGGYDEIDIPILVQVAKARMVQNEKTRLMTQWRNATRRGYFTLDDYARSAAAALETQAAIDIQLQEIILMRENDRRDALADRFKRMYQSEQLSHDDLRVALSALIADPAILERELTEERLTHDRVVRQRVDREVAQETSRVQAQAIQVYKTQLREGLITADTFIAQAVALGVDEQLAALIAQTNAALVQRELDLAGQRAQASEEERIRSLLAQAYETRFQAGEISEEELESLLLAAGFSSQLAAAFATRASARAAARALREAEQEAQRQQRLTDAAELRRSRQLEAEQRAEALRLQTVVIERVRLQLRRGLTTAAQAAADLAAAAIPPTRSREILAAEAARAATPVS